MTSADDDEAERRRRARALLNATTPGRSLAVGRCNLALDTFRNDREGGGCGGGGLREVRALLGDALFCSNVHHPTIYRASISMEVEAGADARGVRELFEGWRIWYLRGARAAKNRDDDGEEEERWSVAHPVHPVAPPVRPSQDEGGFWCHYIDFELRHGTDASARCVEERAVAACPRDPAVHAKYAKAELCLGCPSRATAVLLSALDAFAADVGTREWLEKEVTAYNDSMRHGSWGRLRGLLPSLCRRRVRPAPGYELLAVA
ncbi:unnamed protein product [Miscanthus lutarioriparius]|uniref:Uncharacterized protein n=1 Tax=Miscanthus lutarioriparius TaxID=422564 RepID=A0A811QYD0_9POAL|nr:unnamed protein product [Miscanthus lutarioriparius]